MFKMNHKKKCYITQNDGILSEISREQWNENEDESKEPNKCQETYR